MEDQLSREEPNNMISLSPLTPLSRVDYVCYTLITGGQDEKNNRSSFCSYQFLGQLTGLYFWVISICIPYM